MNGSFDFCVGLLLSIFLSFIGLCLALLDSDKMKIGAAIGILIEILAGIITLVICLPMITV